MIIRGKAAEVWDKDKERALLALTRKFVGEHMEKGSHYITKEKDPCRVYKVIIHNIMGKASYK